MLGCNMRRCTTDRRAEALGLHYEARLRGLPQATQVAFVTRAEGFSPPAARRLSLARQHDRKRAAGARRAAHRHLAAVRLDHMPDNR